MWLRLLAVAFLFGLALGCFAYFSGLRGIVMQRFFFVLVLVSGLGVCYFAYLVSDVERQALAAEEAAYVGLK